MKGRRFFALLWRVNAVVIFAAGTVGLFVLLFAAAVVYKEVTRPGHVAAAANIARQQPDADATHVGEFRPLGDGTILRAPLYLANEQYAVGSSSSSMHSTRNYLFYDTSSQQAYWLISGHRGQILKTEDLPEADCPDDDQSPVVITYYVLVDRDTDGDGELTDQDSKSFAVSDPSGRRFARLLDEMDQINGGHLDASGRLVVFFTSNASLRTARIDPSTHEVLSNVEIEPAP